MSYLLSKIKQVDRPAAGVLERAGLFTNSQILALTRDDLRDLFPKDEDFQRRRTLFDIIHEQPITEHLLQNVKGFMPHDFFKAALTNNGVLVDYLQHLKDMRTQMEGQMSFINAHIDLLEELKKDEPDGRQADHSQGGGGAGSSYGDEQMELQDGSTSNDPQGAPGQSASVIRDPVASSKRTQGWPGKTRVEGGKSASAMSYYKGSESEPHCFQGRPGKTRVEGGKSALATSYYKGSESEPHCFQGRPGKTRVEGGSSHGATGWPGKTRAEGGKSALATSYYKGSESEPHYFQGQSASVIRDPVASSKRTRAKLLYKMVVSGKTFGNHMKLMAEVEKEVSKQMQLRVDNQDYELTVVFCPISSRVGTDVDLALADIRDKKPIILVLMHHAYEVKAVTSMKTWPEDANVVLRVNVFYHETMGLLTCEENDAAVTQIKHTLLTRFNKGSHDTSENAEGEDGVLSKFKSITKYFPGVTGS